MRILAFVASCLCGTVYYLWAVAPLWTLGPYQSAQLFTMNRSISQCIVFLKKPSGWHFETLDTRTGACLNSAKVEIPEKGYGVHSSRTEGELPFESLLGVVHYSMPKSQVNPTSTNCALIFDPLTGECLTPKPLEGYWLASTLYEAGRIVVPLQHSVLVMDKASRKQRHLDVKHFARIEWLPDHQHLVACTRDQLLIVSLSSGRIIAQCERNDNSAYLLSVLSNNTILVGCYKDDSSNHYQLERWKWDGGTTLRRDRRLELFPIDASGDYGKFTGNTFKLNAHGQLIIDLFPRHTWPRGLRSFFTWLEEKKWKVDNLFPKDMFVVRHVIDDDFREVSREEATRSNSVPSSQNTAIHYKHIQYLGGPLKLSSYRTHPQWPNALAIGIVTFLLCHIYLLARRLPAKST
jgi:hypothetical protein